MTWCPPESVRGFLGCFPRFDSRVSHRTFPAKQFPQGCRSVTSHLTRLALQVTHANLARFRGGSDMWPTRFRGEESEVGYQPLISSVSGLAAVASFVQCWSMGWRCQELCTVGRLDLASVCLHAGRL